jgi:hypothetical protein
MLTSGHSNLLHPRMPRSRRRGRRSDRLSAYQSCWEKTEKKSHPFPEPKRQSFVPRSAPALTSFRWLLERESRISSTIRSDKNEATVSFTSLWQQRAGKLFNLYWGFSKNGGGAGGGGTCEAVPIGQLGFHSYLWKWNGKTMRIGLRIPPK